MTGRCIYVVPNHSQASTRDPRCLESWNQSLSVGQIYALLVSIAGFSASIPYINELQACLTASTPSALLVGSGHYAQMMLFLFVVVRNTEYQPPFSVNLPELGPVCTSTETSAGFRILSGVRTPMGIKYSDPSDTCTYEISRGIFGVYRQLTRSWMGHGNHDVHVPFPTLRCIPCLPT